MIAKESMFCEERQAVVGVLVEVAKSTKGNPAHHPIGCDSAHNCKRTVFCRFVNPLTVRTPLAPLPADGQAQSA